MIIKGEARTSIPPSWRTFSTAIRRSFEAAVVGVPHDVYGEDVLAWVVLKEGEQADAAEIISFVKERTVPFKAPSEVRLPRRAAEGRRQGKILRRELRERAAKG